LIPNIPNVLNIGYQRYIGRQNYIPDIEYRVIYRDMILNIRCHTRWRIYTWLPT